MKHNQTFVFKHPISRYISRLIISVLLAALFIHGGMSSAKDLYIAGVANSNSSDHIHLNTTFFSYINNRREHFWPYEENATSDLDAGVVAHRYSGRASGTRFTGYRLQQVLGHQFSAPIYLGGKLGFHRLHVTGFEDEQDLISYDLEAHIRLPENVSTHIETAKDYVYPLGLQPAGVLEFLRARKWRGDIEWKPVKSIRIIGAGSAWKLSDDNFRRENKISMLYGISPDWPWIWAGVSYEVLHYGQRDPDYWTPDKFRAASLVFESSFPIYEDLSGAVSASLSRIKEDDNPQGNGGSLFIGFDQKLIGPHILRLGFNRIRSAQGASDWSENSYNLSVAGSF